MATVFQQLPLAAAIPDPLAGADFGRVDGTSFPLDFIAFDGGSADESVYFRFRALGYGSGNVTLELDWYAATANSGAVRWQAQLAAVTPDADNVDLESKAFAAAAAVNDDHLGGQGKRLHRATVTLTALDGLAADDMVELRVAREASDTGNDTMAGDARLVLATVSYSDT